MGSPADIFNPFGGTPASGWGGLNVAERAKRRAFITNVDGSKIIDFQFTPTGFSGEETASYNVKNKTGVHDADMLWVSGNSHSLPIEIFIDRTEESVGTGKQVDKFAPLDTNKTYFMYDAEQYVLAMRAVAEGLYNGIPASRIVKTDYAVSPEFAQGDENTRNANGVYPDLLNFLYFVRPKGYVSTDAKVSSYDVKTVRGFFKYKSRVAQKFVPPPMLRYFFGNIWVEGYASGFTYELSMVNKDLIPLRLTGTLNIHVSDWGILSSINAHIAGVDVYITINESTGEITKTSSPIIYEQ